MCDRSLEKNFAQLLDIQHQISYSNRRLRNALPATMNGKQATHTEHTITTRQNKMFTLINPPVGNFRPKAGNLPVYFSRDGIWFELSEVVDGYAWSVYGKKFALDRIECFAHYDAAQNDEVWEGTEG